MYNIIYSLDHKCGEFTEEQVMAEVEKNPEHTGATDSFMFVSIINGEDDSTSTLVLSVDGKTNAPLPDAELFKVWFSIAKDLADKDIPNWQREIVSNTFEAVKKRLAKG